MRDLHHGPQTICRHVKTLGMQNHVMKWIGWAGADAFVRLLLLGGATVVLSRLLDAADFGVSAIVLATTAAAGLLVGAPFQDALTQRHVLRKLHLQSALGVSLGVATVLIAASLAVAPLMATAYGAPEISYLLPITMLSILFSGHAELVGARARRRRRFTDIAAADLVSHLIAAPLAVAAAFLGAGVWSLIMLRLASVVVQSVMLQTRIGYPLRPRLSRPHLADLRRIASIASLDRITDNLTYLVFNNLVVSFFGLAVLGQMNMAMRIIEPIRGAVMAALHNLTFPHFRRIALQNTSSFERDQPVLLLANVTAPIFAGLACVTPLLLPLVTGAGWEEAIPIAICLALGAALAMPAQPIFTALLAEGTPEYGLLGSLTRLSITLLALIALRDWPPLAVGLARLFGDGAAAFLALAVPLKRQQWPVRQRLMLLLPAWGTTGVMSIATIAAIFWLQPFGNWAALAGSILTGIFIQILLLRSLQPNVMTELLQTVLPARRP